ncbi:MAG: DUF5667 domain-containing protein, partial [Patescibacteria group bacterium]|nr:DUF5667 domain-containing protein [Patescibacteria group bacterium]
AENFSIFKFPVKLFKTIPQPVLAVFLIVLFMLSSGVASIKASQDAKPGDSFYIAKIVSEKTQLALTFDKRKKVQLGIEFAGNRAKELDQVLADENNSETQEKVDKLVINFKKEIAGIKDRVAKISLQNTSDRFDFNYKTEEHLIEKNINKNINNEDAVQIEEGGVTMFAVNLDKDDNSIELSETAEEIKEPTLEEANAEEAQATSVPLKIETFNLNSSSTEKAEFGLNSAGDTQGILDQAGLFLENEDYEAAIDKLEEADKAIDLVGIGRVKGDSESSTTTESVEAEEGAEESGSETASTTE